ncbi:MAG: DUF975 family protein [Clostridia bacterium]|nr:DUF975 family protein [Clostridia bacterium]
MPYDNMSYSPYRIVQETPRTMRALARQALAGRWLESFLLLVVVAAISSVPQMILNAPGNAVLSFVATLYSLLIQGPLSLGVAYYFIKLFRQQEGGIDDLRYGASYAAKAIALYLHMIIRIFLWSLLFVIPGIIAALRYSMAFNILADDPGKAPVQCLMESSEMMRGNKMGLFILALTFIGWALLASIPQSLVEGIQMRAFDLGAVMQTPELYYETVAKISSNPLVALAGVPMYIVNAYLNTAEVAFYDLANGNLSVGGGMGGYDYYGAKGSVEDPFTGENVTFTDVPTEVKPAEDLPETFEDPELKEAESRYSDEE